MATAMMASRSATETISVEPTLQMRLKVPQPPTRQPDRNTKIKNRLRLDPSRALEPARKKINTIEAQRVMSVFEETIHRSEIVTLLPFIMTNLDRFRVGFGSELAGLLEHHKVLHQSYEEIKEQLEKQMRKHEMKSKRSSPSPQPGGSPLPEHGDSEAVADAEEPAVDDDALLPVTDEDDRRSIHSSREGSARSRGGSASSVRSGLSIDSQTDRVLRNLTLVAQELSFSCKSILRGFALNPAAINSVKAEYSKRSSDAEEFVRAMHDLKEILLNKLLTTPEEEKERMEYLREISKRERNNATIIEKLEAELATAVADKDEEIKKKNDIIRRLQSDLHQIEKFSEEHIRRVRDEAEKQESADLKNSEGKKQKLTQEVAQLRTQLQNLVMEHRDNEQELRRKKYKIETEVENWIQKYDQDMGERQDEYEEIDAIYTEEKKQLHELEERFKTLEAEYQQIMEERRISRERREAAEREMALMVKAATTVQAFWRSYKVRKALKARKKKKGGGGKKKK